MYHTSQDLILNHHLFRSYWNEGDKKWPQWPFHQKCRTIMIQLSLPHVIYQLRWCANWWPQHVFWEHDQFFPLLALSYHFMSSLLNKTICSYLYLSMHQMLNLNQYCFRGNASQPVSQSVSGNASQSVSQSVSRGQRRSSHLTPGEEKTSHEWLERYPVSLLGGRQLWLSWIQV